MRWMYAISWVLLSAVAFGLAPPNRPDLSAWLIRLLVGDVGGENPMVVAHFYMMALWPLTMAAVWRREWSRPGRLPAWPFLLGAFGLGCFALLPYAALRAEPDLEDPGVPSWIWGALAAGFAGLGAWGLGAGDLGAWWAAVQSDGFMWPMTWDFCAFFALFVLERRARSATA